MKRTTDPRTIGACFLLGLALLAGVSRADQDQGGHPGMDDNSGPYNVIVLEGGVGLARPLSVDGPVAASAPWSLSGWIRSDRRQPGQVIVTALGRVGQVSDADWRGIALADGRVRALVAPGTALNGAGRLEPGRWYAVAVTYDGAVARLYVDGTEEDSAPASTRAVDPRIEIAPAAPAAPAADPRVPHAGHFGGSLALFKLDRFALSAQELRSLAGTRPTFSLITFDHVGAGWPWQQHAWRGLQQPQDPWTLPRAHAAPSTPHAETPQISAELQPQTGGFSLLRWRLAPAPSISASGEQLSQPLYSDADWYPAIVPGTVLTALIARGVYPDPDYGLNNLAIPDRLSRQDYWYRTDFTAPESFRGRELTLTFEGINYAAEVWMNGTPLGSIRGAFTRGIFDITGNVAPGGRNAIAVRVSPPPHPGIPHEQSMAAGPGNNGGALAIDGPTFIATEGWDWIPGIRDRNTGIWQPVRIKATGVLHLHDPQVITHLPLPRTDSADISISVPVENRGDTAMAATVRAQFDAVRIEKAVMLNPGTTEVILDAHEFSALHLTAPRLWWPNGYGDANLYALELEVRSGNTVSDSASLRFGIRELTYELSLFDHDGRLRRVEINPTRGTMQHERLIDVSHEAIKQTPQGWAESLTPAGESSTAVRASATESLSPYLVIHVNGVPIAARGGSWGMDDSRKRSSRAHLEPYFRLHRDAHLNIIRNWLGQNTEETFYDLADEYGLLVLNDFWVSTQDFQMEPQDPALFLANAHDVISRYRNHPSIAVWFGRNEGVPQPILNSGLAELAATLDGTRYYTGSSNSVNLQVSGPYNYRPPEDYFTTLAQGFSVEVGTPSLSTLESLEASIPAADRWPLNDTYAYHDWHFGGNGDVATFMAALAEQYGAASSLEDFEKKAQLMNFVSYRAIFEGFQAHLWTRNSGRLLWMTHPAWPSNTWQIYSSDYDTGAAYYAVKKACEPVHAQLNLPDFSLAVVNTTRSARNHLTLHARLFTLDGTEASRRTVHLDAPANAVTTPARLSELVRLLAQQRVVLVALTLTDSSGAVLSDNVYWQSSTPADQQRLNGLAPQAVDMAVHGQPSGGGTQVSIRLTNRGTAPSLNNKVTMLDHSGSRALPAYYSDNYLTLLPGESREVRIECAVPCSRAALRGWNTAPRELPITMREANR